MTTALIAFDSLVVLACLILAANLVRLKLLRRGQLRDLERQNAEVRASVQAALDHRDRLYGRTIHGGRPAAGSPPAAVPTVRAVVPGDRPGVRPGHAHRPVLALGSHVDESTSR